MWTSTASKPASAKAAAISTWPLTPCSRRIATAGLAASFRMLGSASGSYVNANVMPGSASSAALARSCSAQAGLSRSARMRMEFSDQMARISRSGMSSATASPQRTTSALASATSPTTAAATPASAKALSTVSTSAAATCMTMPGSSQKSAARASCASAAAGRVTTPPRPPAMHISARVAARPPSERSWAARMRRSASRRWKAAKKAPSGAGSSMSGTSPPTTL